MFYEKAKNEDIALEPLVFIVAGLSDVSIDTDDDDEEMRPVLSDVTYQSVFML